MAKKSNAQPDAWLKLVLQQMSATELRQELAGEGLSADERRWMVEELRRKEGGR